MSKKTGEQKTACTWTEDIDGVWESKCGELFQFENDGAIENGFVFCPYCGKPITAVCEGGA